MPNINFTAVNEAVRVLRFRYRGIENDLMLFASLDDLEQDEADKAILEIYETLTQSVDPNIKAEVEKAKGIGILKPRQRDLLTA